MFSIMSRLLGGKTERRLFEVLFLHGRTSHPAKSRLAMSQSPPAEGQTERQASRQAPKSFFREVHAASEPRRHILKMLAVAALTTPFTRFGRFRAPYSDIDGAEAVFDRTTRGISCRFRLYRDGALIRETARDVGNMTVGEFEEIFSRFQSERL